MVIFDTAATVGGVWAKERLYPGLKTNNLVGTYEFSDFPMNPARFDLEPGQHIPGEIVHRYLAEFAQHFDLMPRMRLNRKVASAELLNDGTWLLSILDVRNDHNGSVPERLVARKLVVATGLTSEPHQPVFPGQETFNRDIFHAKELRDRSHSLEISRDVLVLGGNKSAWDTCFFAANCGAHVHMVIRPGGGGPSWVWPLFVTPFKISVQRLATTRVFTWFDPCIWSEKAGPISWIRYALHKTWLGRKLVSAFWKAFGNFARRAHRYDEHPETSKLKPWVSPFWMGNSLSIHNYTSSWFKLVRQGQIAVHIADVDCLSEGTVHLSNGDDIQVDAFVCCTGWKTRPSIRFLPQTVDSMLVMDEDTCETQSLVEKARAQIFANIPAMTEPLRRTLPQGSKLPAFDTRMSDSADKHGHAYRLYRFMVPPNERLLEQRNIAFMGFHLALNATMIAQLQALWITAFFTDEIDHLRNMATSFEEIRYSAVLHNEYSRIRHPPAADEIWGFRYTLSEPEERVSGQSCATDTGQGITQKPAPDLLDEVIL
ncbi:hypothetical protein O9K51_07181 [Purpureocillium lavendulum]|uniref:L-ornithine N(5)-oxygenase n=1 Tax=Purpureocillium lavendulum TaxID=1247861 RepID=A0AB34FKV8_9HYPO|nr:hypothetical protein O9K51_07181 [Purpureocillium lavendulum]